jgi:hypothetical protein
MRWKTILVKVEICAPTKGAETATVIKYGDDLGDECQGHFLNLGQGLNEGDADADKHCHEHRRAGGDKHGPDRGLDDIEGVGFVHL